MSAHRTFAVTGKRLGVSSFGTPYFLFKHIDGREAINENFHYELILTTQDEYGNGIVDEYISKSAALAGGVPGSNLDLKSLIGSSVTLAIELDGKVMGLTTLIGQGTRHINGIVTQASYIGTSGRHAQYRLRLSAWTHILTLTQNSRVFQRMSIPDIIRAVLDAYPYPVETRLTAEYPVLDYVVQYQESDHAFISRLMQSVGINYHFSHVLDKHTLILSDGLSGFKPMDSLAYQHLSVLPPDILQGEEYIDVFNPAQALTTGQIRLSDYQFKSPKADQSVSAHNPWDTAHNQLERYEWHQGGYLSPHEGGEFMANIRMQEQRQQGQRCTGSGNLRGLQTGHSFSLSNHPTEDANRGWIVLAQQFTAHEIPAESRSNSDERYAVSAQFIVQPDTEQIRPERVTPKPQARLQTATVVGPADKELWTDQYGRVKVQFHWENKRSAVSADANMSAANVKRSGSSQRAVGDENSSCWIRVSTPWSGTNYGGTHVPRIGQEVIVDFLNADPDMPIIVGRVNNPNTMPSWELPTQQALSGFKSKELYGARNNYLVMDDTTEQVQVQLSTDHQLSQLNLGYVTRIPDTKGRKDYRGQGFELRTDGWGVIRSAKGMVLTTYAKSNAAGHIKDIGETTGLLKSAHSQHQSYAQLAIDHKADERSIDDTAQVQLKAQNEEVAGKTDSSADKFPELSTPHLVISSPAGIALATPKSTHIASNEHIALTTGKDLSMSVGQRLIASVSKGISLFTQSTGIKMFAAKGKVEIQAQSDDVEIIADQVLKLISAQSKIEIVAHDEILLTAKGSYIKINGKGIEQGTPANWKVHAASHGLPGPKGLTPAMPQMPKAFDIKVDVYDLFWDFGMAKVGYQAVSDSGECFEGLLDEHGRTARMSSNKQEKLEVLFDTGTEWSETFIPVGRDNSNT